MATREKTIYTSKNPSKILEYLSNKNEFLYEIASRSYDDILLICKSISHSDIPFAKRTNKNDSLEVVIYELEASELPPLTLTLRSRGNSPNDKHKAILKLKFAFLC